jgi:sugar lactone lactonase YvrE
MEVFSFGDDLDLGQVLDAVVTDTGDVLLLSFKEGRTLVTRCDFRGVPIGPLEITNLPADLSFVANRMVIGTNALYFVSTNASSVVVTSLQGEFREHLDLLSLVDAEAKQKVGAEIIGFAVDRDGSLYFSVPVLFRVCKVAPDRTVTSFGRPGSGPGRFGVLAGVAVDSSGHVLVADKLRCVVMVFDRDFTFLTEFGYRGPRPGNLVVPDDIAVDQQDRVYVSQGRSRGVSVFALAGG